MVFIPKQIGQRCCAGPGHNEPRLTADVRTGGLEIVQISCHEVIKANMFSRGRFAGHERPLPVLVPTAHPRNPFVDIRLRVQLRVTDQFKHLSDEPIIPNQRRVF